ncbi:uncharacterized protein LOC135142449 [Zophobas morio]|uniref:uncharacterized protein LOC135142449 n=1 Tax=Zophobas morio TaxID=2755281 RepID=UPI0030828493
MLFKHKDYDNVKKYAQEIKELNPPYNDFLLHNRIIYNYFLKKEQSRALDYFESILTNGFPLCYGFIRKLLLSLMQSDLHESALDLGVRLITFQEAVNFEILEILFTCALHCNSLERGIKLVKYLEKLVSDRSLTARSTADLLHLSGAYSSAILLLLEHRKVKEALYYFVKMHEAGCPSTSLSEKVTLELHSLLEGSPEANLEPSSASHSS